ncbi:MAG: hypothetical protein MUD01_09630 [Chloroflexaceae bacterium]|jgi:hypothetical protein|nr:hypothetical protein [Chloroflexaceae bacterium]
MATSRFLMWYDDNPKVPLIIKIEEAVEAYTKRFRGNPNLVLVNEEDVIDFQGVKVRGVAHVRRNNFWVGVEDQAA